MPITSIVYRQPVRRPRRAFRLDYQRYDEAQALADVGEYGAALHKVLAHLFPTAELPDLAVAPFVFTHGSIRVTVRREGNDVAISVPLVRLPTGGRALAALRHVLTKASSLGQLYLPRLRGDDVHFEFRDKLSRLHPAKVLEVLLRMPDVADDCQEWLIGQFGALPLDRAPIEALRDEELQRAETEWRTHWNDIEELTRESQRKCSAFFLDSVTLYAVKRVCLALPIRGLLYCRLNEAARAFSDRDADPHQRNAALARCAREMVAVSGDELRGSLGHAEYGIYSLTDGTARNLRDWLGPVEYSATIDELRKAGHPMDAAVALLAAYTNLLVTFAWPAATEAALKDGLAQASGKPWRQAAALLFDHGRALVTLAESKTVEAENRPAIGDRSTEAPRG